MTVPFPVGTCLAAGLLACRFFIFVSAQVLGSGSRFRLIYSAASPSWGRLACDATLALGSPRPAGGAPSLVIVLVEMLVEMRDSVNNGQPVGHSYQARASIASKGQNKCA